MERMKGASHCPDAPTEITTTYFWRIFLAALKMNRGHAASHKPRRRQEVSARPCRCWEATGGGGLVTTRSLICSWHSEASPAKKWWTTFKEASQATKPSLFNNMETKLCLTDGETGWKAGLSNPHQLSWISNHVRPAAKLWPRGAWEERNLGPSLLTPSPLAQSPAGNKLPSHWGKGVGHFSKYVHF